MKYFYARTIYEEDREEIYSFTLENKLTAVIPDGFIGDRNIPVFSQSVLFPFIKNSIMCKIHGDFTVELEKGNSFSADLVGGNDGKPSIFFSPVPSDLVIKKNREHAITIYNFKEVFSFHSWDDFHKVKDAVSNKNYSLAKILIKKRIRFLNNSDFFYKISQEEAKVFTESAIECICTLQAKKSTFVPISLEEISNLTPREVKENDFILFSMGDKMNYKLIFIEDYATKKLNLYVRSLVSGELSPISLIDQAFIIKQN